MIISGQCGTDATAKTGRRRVNKRTRAVMPACMTMEIGVPAERAPGERRVALTPSVVGKLTGMATRGPVEEGAGAGAGFSDSDYQAAGAEIVDRTHGSQPPAGGGDRPARRPPGRGDDHRSPQTAGTPG